MNNKDTARKKTQKTVKKGVVTYFRVSTASEKKKSSKLAENEAELLGEPVQVEYRKKRNHNKKEETI